MSVRQQNESLTLWKKKKNSLVHNHQARILQVVAYLLPRWEGRTEFIKKKQRSSRPFQPTSVN